MSTTATAKYHRLCADRVRKELDWTEEDYSEFKYAQGLAFLPAVLGGDTALAARLESSKLFWGWFKCIWAVLEDNWIAHVDDTPEPRSTSAKCREFIIMFDGVSLAVDYYPPSAVLEGCGEWVVRHELQTLETVAA